MDNSGKNRRSSNRFAPLLLAATAVGSAFLFPASSAEAQTPTGNAAVQQARLFNQRPTNGRSGNGERLFPSLDTMNGGVSAADLDVGEQWMLRPNLPANPFTGHASISLFYTSNVALSRTAELGDAFAVADVGVGYNRAIAPDWAIAINLQQSFFRYDRYTDFDFESSNAHVALSHQARQLGNVVFSLQYSFNRLTSGSADDQIYLGNTVALAASKVVQISSADSIDFNTSLGYTLADPDDLERAEFRFAVGYNVKFARNFTVSAVTRLELYDYTHEAREDFLQTIALGARWDVTDWMFISASVSAANNVSTQRVFEYGAINTGATLTAHIRF